MWAQRVVGLRGSGSLRPGLPPAFWRSPVSLEVRLSLSVSGSSRLAQALAGSQSFCSSPLVAMASCGSQSLSSSARVALSCSSPLLPHVVFRGYSVARLPLLEAQAFVVVDLSLRSGGLLALRCLSGFCFVLTMPAILGWVQVRGSYLAVMSCSTGLGAGVASVPGGVKIPGS